jgi:hypothetical protein
MRIPGGIGWLPDDPGKVDPDLRTFLNVNRPEDLQATAGFMAQYGSFDAFC